MKKIIHINRNILQQNEKHDERKPICRIQEGKFVRYAYEIIIHGDSKMVYNPDNPLKCGAKLWIETEAEVEILR